MLIVAEVSDGVERALDEGPGGTDLYTGFCHELTMPTSLVKKKLGFGLITSKIFVSSNIF